MKKKLNVKIMMLMSVVLSTALLLASCGIRKVNETDEYELPENVIMTETGEMIEKEEPEEIVTPTPTADEIEPETDEIQLEMDEIFVPITPQVDFVIPEPVQTSDEAESIEIPSSEMQLVFLGDSIFDNNRDGTGVPYLTAKKCDAYLFNLAIGGTSASIEFGESTESDKWTSRSLCGIVKAMNKEIPTDIFAGLSAQKILDNPEIDFSKTDYFIVEYGINDYFRAAPLSIDSTYTDIRSYTGALQFAVDKLRDIAPDATIILCSPTYARFFNSDGFMVGDGNVSNTGYGTLFDYKGSINYVANSEQTLFFNAYQDLGIDGYTADEYLEDGVHLTEAGRELYADALSKMILKYEETKNN